MILRRILIAALFLGSTHASAQPGKAPTADDVRALQKQYRAESEQAVKSGAAQRVPPGVMQRAAELAAKSEAALAAGRLWQAADAIRQARWQVPYQPALPPHVSRVLGNLRLRHLDQLVAVAYSPDGTRLATASSPLGEGSDFTIKIWDLGNGHELLAYTGHSAKINALLWSTDGKSIISAGAEKTIRIWNARSGEDIKTIDAAGKQVTALALSRDGKHLFTGQLELDGGTEAGLFVYELASGKEVRKARDFTNQIDTLALSPDGSILAVTSSNGTLRFYQYPTFVDDSTTPPYWMHQDAANGAIYHVSFSPDGKTIARTGQFGVHLYDVVPPGAAFKVAMPRLALRKANWQPRRAIFARDGKTVFAGGLDGSIYHFDPETGQEVGAFPNAHVGGVNGLVLNAAGNQLASCGGDHAARLWDLDFVLTAREFAGHAGPVWNAAFSPDGTRVVSAAADKTVKIWDRETGTLLLTLTGHQAPVTVALFSPDGKVVASAGGDRVIRIYDAAHGKPLRTCAGHLGTITSLDFARDGRLVSGAADRRIKIWNVDTGAQLLSIHNHPSIVAGVAFSPSGKQIAVGSVDQTIRLYDAATGKLQHTWVAHASAVGGVAFSPDGQFLASCGADANVMIWPLATPGVNAIRCLGHTGPVSAVAFRNDSRHLVSCGADQLVKLWKLEGAVGKEVQTFRAHKDWVTSVAFSADGHQIVSSSVDRKLKMWEITTRDIPSLSEHWSSVETVAVSPDGTRIASGSKDQTIKLWDRATGAEIATLPCRPQYPPSLAFLPDGQTMIGATLSSSLRFWGISPPRELEQTPAQAGTFSQLSADPYYVALDPAGKTALVWLVTRDDRRSTRLDAYGVQTGQQLFSASEDNRIIKSVTFCANGQLAATGSTNGSVRVWEFKLNKANIAPGGDWFLFDKTDVGDIALTPDGKLLIASSVKGELKIAKLAGRQVLHSLNAHAGEVRVVQVNADGKRFITAGADNVVKLWETESGKELRRWDFGKTSDALIQSAAFTPDGRQLVTANKNTTVYVLDLP